MKRKVSLLGALALLGVLFVFPVLYAGYLGFTNLALVGSRSHDYEFTGLDNVTAIVSLASSRVSSTTATATF